MLAAGERGQCADRPRDQVGALAGGQAERAERADRHPVGPVVAAAGRGEHGDRSASFAAGDGQGVPGSGLGGAGAPGGRGPGVADQGPEGAPGGVGDGQFDRHGLAEPDGGVTAPPEPQAADGRGEHQVGHDGEQDRAGDQPDPGRRRQQQAHDERAECGEQGGSPGEGHAVRSFGDSSTGRRGTPTGGGSADQWIGGRWISGVRASGRGRPG